MNRRTGRPASTARRAAVGDKSQSFACSNGHVISTEDGHRPARCPIYVLGKPCEGMLTVVGKRAVAR